jgi:hypothetical protein
MQKRFYVVNTVTGKADGPMTQGEASGKLKAAANVELKAMTDEQYALFCRRPKPKPSK